jgi:hypothetical protein
VINSGKGGKGALRLAPLEKFSADGEPLPLLIDDALAHSPESLDKPGGKTQVIFSTHNQHMVHLETEAVAGHILHIQELNAT